MLLVSDDESFKNHANVDDPIGDRDDIPTIIIQKSTGDLIKKNWNNPSKESEQVIMSVKFIAAKEGGVVHFDLYLKSDDVKSLHFFKEFEQYFNKLSKILLISLWEDKIIFRPYYKYYINSHLEYDNRPDAVDNNKPCIKQNRYCAHENYSKNINY